MSTLAAQAVIRTVSVVFPLTQANAAIAALGNGQFDVAALLLPA